MKKYEFEYQMSQNSHRNKRQEKAFLNWINKPAFKNRKPTLDEVMDAMEGGPLKDLVEQDVKKAYKKYLRREAQHWLQSVNVVRINVYTKEVSKPVKAFIRIGPMGKNGTVPEASYVPSKRIMDDPAMTMTVLEKAEREFENWAARYEAYAEFFQVFQPVLEAYESVQEILKAEIRKIKSMRKRA